MPNDDLDLARVELRVVVTRLDMGVVDAADRRCGLEHVLLQRRGGRIDIEAAALVAIKNVELAPRFVIADGGDNA